MSRVCRLRRVGLSRLAANCNGREEATDGQARGEMSGSMSLKSSLRQMSRHEVKRTGLGKIVRLSQVVPDMELIAIRRVGVPFRRGHDRSKGVLAAGVGQPRFL